jgi:hypothetical protein
VRKGPATSNTSGLNTRKATMVSLYQYGALPRKLLKKGLVWLFGIRSPFSIRLVMPRRRSVDQKKKPPTKASAFVSGPTYKNSPESQLHPPDPHSNTKSISTTRMAKVRSKVKSFWLWDSRLSCGADTSPRSTAKAIPAQIEHLVHF